MCFLLLEHNQKNTDDIAEGVTGKPCMSNLIVIHWGDVTCNEGTVQCVYARKCSLWSNKKTP